jgi:CheY-like chemotaxis protein
MKKIIAIDNIPWDLPFEGLEKVIYVQGFTMQEIIEEEITPIKKEQEKNKTDLVYLINVHCAFSISKTKNTFLQNQSGIDFYRQLLLLYSDCSEKLRVAFFSPLPRKELLRQKPENGVLEFHELIESPFSWNTCVQKIEKWKWNTFNNASENLLSGYGLFKQDKVKTSDKRVAFIDDQSEEWKTTFNEIFEIKPMTGKKIEFLNYDKDETSDGIFSSTKIKDFKTKIKQADLIISDFYLEETHEPNYWQSSEELKEKSGFKLFNEIRKENKGVPVVMHTSSNKISYYKLFDMHGVDNWLIKDIRPDASKDERKESYFAFKKSFEYIFQNPYYEYLKELWKKISELESLAQKTWWFSNSNFSTFIPANAPVNINESRKKIIGKGNYSHLECWHVKQADFEAKKQIVKIIKSSWFAIRRLLNRETVFEQISEDDSEGLVFDSFTPNAICNNLGKCLEMLNIKSGNIRFSYLTNSLINIRNSASHSTDYQYYRLDDAIIYLDYLLKILLFKTRKEDELEIVNEFRHEWLNEEEGDFIKRATDKEGYDQYECSMFWIYIQFYNQEFSAKDSKFGHHL